MSSLAISPAGRLWKGHATSLCAIVLVGIVASELVRLYPASMPVWMPYEFSWGVYLATALSVDWYLRGLVGTSGDVRPRTLRTVSFLIGVILIYLSMHTWLDFAAQHMFFIHRLQHLVLHHTGPFLIALSNPIETLRRGMPSTVRRGLDSGFVRGTMKVVQQPVLASILFVALIYIWPLPPVHFRAMLDPKLYTVMNWSVTIDGILFWALVLDPRPKAEAGLSYGARFICVVAVMFPQIVLGAIVSFSTRDFYQVYEICGRIMDMTGLQDQALAGLILWIPSSMMSIVGALLILNFLRLNEETRDARVDANVTLD